MLEFQSGDKSFSQDILEPGLQTLGLPHVLVFPGCSSALGQQRLLYPPRFSKVMLGVFFEESIPVADGIRNVAVRCSSPR